MFNDTFNPWDVPGLSWESLENVFCNFSKLLVPKSKVVRQSVVCQMQCFKTYWQLINWRKGSSVILTMETIKSKQDIRISSKDCHTLPGVHSSSYLSWVWQDKADCAISNISFVQSTLLLQRNYFIKHTFVLIKTKCPLILRLNAS